MRSLTIFLIFFSTGFYAQRSFQRGTLVFDFHTGIEAYQSRNIYKSIQSGEITDTTVRTNVGNSNMSLGAEIGIGRFIGIGLRGKMNTFFRSLDAVMNARADITSADMLLMVNLHPIATKRFDLLLGTEIGLSKLKYDVNDLAQTLITGNGSYFSLYLNPRFYLKRFGFNLRTSLPLFNYGNLRQSGEQSAAYMISAWRGSGFGISLGAQFRLF